MNIVRDFKVLEQISSPVESVEEAQNIVKLLELVLGEYTNGVGLSAIQVGIPKQVFIIREENNFRSIINPKVTLEKDLFIFKGEGCLSFPNIYVNKGRYRIFNIINNVIEEGKFVEKEEKYTYKSAKDVISIAIQHEIDHFSGKLIIKEQTNMPEIGRNDPCPCGSGKKFKKCCLK